jgi:hypothetical protein
MVVVFLATAVEGLAVQRYDVGRAGFGPAIAPSAAHRVGVIVCEQVRVDRQSRRLDRVGRTGSTA